jgi:hypothetical protein
MNLECKKCGGASPERFASTAVKRFSLYHLSLCLIQFNLSVASMSNCHPDSFNNVLLRSSLHLLVPGFFFNLCVSRDGVLDSE